MSRDNSGVITRDAFRNAMGKFASGVTVITVNIKGDVHGMTASAFFSLSLDPPLIAVSVDNRARIRPLIPECGAFGISFLAREQEACSNHFAGMIQEGLDIRFEEYQGFSLVESALARVCCTLESELPGGDHTIMVGRVVHLDALEDGDPLLYYSGGYHSLAEKS